MSVIALFSDLSAHLRSPEFLQAARQLSTKKRINHAYVFTALKPLLPALLIGKKAVKLMRNVLKLVAKQTYRHVENLAKPRKSRPKPHKHMTQKNC